MATPQTKNISIDQIAITMSTNIPGQTDLELTSDMFATDAPANFKTEKYPFISDTVLLNEAVLKTKRYTDILRIFFMRNEFYTFNRDGRNPVIPLTGTHTQIQKQQAKMVTDNIKIMLRYLFDTYPTVSNYTNSLDGTFETSLSIKEHKYSHLVIGSKVYTVARIVWINDIFEHPVYDTFVNDYNKFERWREGEVHNITNTNEKQLKNMEKTLKDFNNTADMDTLKDDIDKIDAFLGNKNNWTGRGASDAVKRNAMVILEIYMKYIEKKLKTPTAVVVGGAMTDTMKAIKKQYNLEDVKIGLLKAAIEILRKKYINIISNDYLEEREESVQSKKRKTMTRTNGPSMRSDIAQMIEKLAAIGEMDNSDADQSNKELLEAIRKHDSDIDTNEYDTTNLYKQIEENLTSIVTEMGNSDFFNKMKTTNTSYKSKNNKTRNIEDMIKIVREMDDDFMKKIDLIDADIAKIEDKLSKVSELFKHNNKTIVLEQGIDTDKDNKIRAEISDKLLKAKVALTDADFLSELNRTYKIIMDSNIITLSLVVKTLIKDITEKNQKIVKLQEVIKYLDTDMFENFKKIEYDNPSYNTLVEAVFGDKRKISKMINHTINNPPKELTKKELGELSSNIETQTNKTKYGDQDDFVTGISYDNTAVDKPRYSIYMFVDFIDGKADDINHNLDLCSFRDELLYNDLTLMTSNNVQKTIHDPLIQLIIPAKAITAGTRRKRSKTSRRTKKNRW